MSADGRPAREPAADAASPPAGAGGKRSLLAVALLALGLGLLFLRNPGLGDDFTYWQLAFELRDGVSGAWSAKSFHALRWPVWGMSWLIQGAIGPGLVSYYGVPLFYLTLGALLAFALGRRVTGKPFAGWVAAVAFILHPLIDFVVFRPMPDLSEAVLSASLVCAWLAMMRADRAGARLGFAALAGLLVALVHANRFTGLLMVPVLIGLTLLFFRRQFGWLLALLAFAAVFIGVECAVYHSITGDWLHSLHANLGARGRKGTESIALWTLPLRFFDSLFKGNNFSTPFMLATLAGGVVAWRRGGTAGRIVVAWGVLLYLGYSCAIQSVNPVRPMLRDAGRFLGSLAIPFAVLIGIGAAFAGDWLRAAPWPAVRRGVAAITACPRLAAVLAIALLIAVTSRELFEVGYIPAFRAYLASRPPGTRVFTQKAMRTFSFLMHGSAARQLAWLPHNSIIEHEPALEADAARADEFWYIRKLVWLRERKSMLYQDKTSPKVLGSYFDAPREQWTLAQVLSVRVNPEFVFYRKRLPADPGPLVFNAAALPGIVPPLPVAWQGESRKQYLTWTIPAALRGKLAQVQIVSRSETVQPILVKTDFLNESGRVLIEPEFKPHVYPTPAKDFFAFRIPPDAVTCRVELGIEKGVKLFELLDVAVTAE